jgi:ABC-type branched-subunit amino acid transport system substrate-binding protein
MVDVGLDNPIQAEPEAPVAARAAATAIDKSGGVNGHKIDIIVCNNQANANQSLVCARDAVSDKVAAVVGQGDIFSPTTIPILAAAGIPTVGINSNGYPIDLNSPDSFPIQSGGIGIAFSYPLVAKDLGKTTIATACADVPAAISECKAVQEATVRAGLKYDGTVVVPDSGVTDYSPYAAKLQNTHAQVVAFVLSPAPGIGILKAAEAIGYKPTFAAAGFGEQEASQANGLAVGLISPQPFPSVRATTEPLTQAFDQQLQGIGVNATATAATTYPHWLNGENAWLAVWGVAAAAKNISGAVTASSLKQELASSPKLTLPGGYSWTPATGGPAPYPRVSNWTLYPTVINNAGQLVDGSLKPVNTATVAVKIPSS